MILQRRERDPLKIKGRQFAAEKQGSPKATMQGDDKGEGVVVAQ